MDDQPSSRKAPRKVLGFALPEVLGGGLAILIGAFTLYESQFYAMGTARRMGPGYFPFLLGLLITACGLCIVLITGRRSEATALPRLPLRALLSVFAAILAFALLIQRLGLAPAVMAASFISTLAEPGVDLRRSAVVAVVLTVLVVVVFRFGLGLRLNIFVW